MVLQALVNLTLIIGNPLVWYYQYKFRNNPFAQALVFAVQLFVLVPLAIVSLFHLLTGTHF